MKKRFILIYLVLVIIIAIIGSSNGDSIKNKIFDSNKYNKKIETLHIVRTQEETYPFSVFENIIPNKEETLKTTEVTSTTAPIKKIAKPFTCDKPKIKYGGMFLLNLGQDVSLPDVTYVPTNLMKLNNASSTKNICLIREAKNSFEEMVAKAKIDGHTIKASSGFRSFDTQQNIIDESIRTGTTNTDIAIAKAGYSEHQLGTAVDLTGESIEYTSASSRFENTPEAKWMETHAVDYGFVESYPKGKEDITGYMYEPWHYRYVGKEIAGEIIKRNITINEYLKELNTKTN